jgi:hypothetical protein
MKCKKQVEILNGAVSQVGKNKTNMMKGKCGSCSTTVCKFLPKDYKG